MLQFVKNQDIFKTDAQYLVNPVNCVGVMGKGLALEFKMRYPYMFEVYKKCCDNKEFIPGRVYFVHDADRMIILFTTKRHWKDKSKLEDIDTGLKDLSEQIDSLLLNGFNFSAAIPKIGCGLGGLNWENQVKPLVFKWLRKYTGDDRVRITILE